MRRATPSFAALVVASVTALSAGVAEAGWWDDLAEPRDAAPASVAADPARWDDIAVRFDARCEPSAAVPATLDPSAWRAFAVRSGDAGLVVVVRAGSPESDRAERLRPGETVRVAGPVRAAAGVAVVEATELVGEGDPMSPSERAEHERAAALLAKDNAPAAERAWRRMLAARDYPRGERAELWAGVARACREQRRLADAAAAYRNVLSLDATHRGAFEDLERITAAIRRADEQAAPQPEQRFARESTSLPPVKLAPPVPADTALPDAPPPTLAAPK